MSDPSPQIKTTPAMLTKIRAAFEGATVTEKNIALRLAHDEIERLQRVILRLVRDDNDCLRKCNGGWDARQCGCAEEARNTYASQL
jgi:hypothetical protein